jgi:hypothetical protein
MRATARSALKARAKPEHYVQPGEVELRGSELFPHPAFALIAIDCPAGGLTSDYDAEPGESQLVRLRVSLYRASTRDRRVAQNGPESVLAGEALGFAQPPQSRASV